MRFIHSDPKTGLADIDRFNLVHQRWKRRIRRRIDGGLILWWRKLWPRTRWRIEITGYVVLILALAALI